MMAKARLSDTQEATELILTKTYNTAMSTAAAQLLELWEAGHVAPTPNGHLEVTKVVAPEGNVVGFNVYLVWGEPRVLGSMRTEPA
jgi:hypothetical protein